LKNKGLLLDTCAWVEYFKPRPSSLKQTVEDLLLTEKIYVCGPVLYELSQGVKSEKEKALLANAFAALVYVEMDEALWFKAGELSAFIRKQGKTIPFSDILIASLAVEYDLAILTLDKHFEQIPGLKLYSPKAK
jgi:predicted nucleic acid-binding protein